MNTGEGVFQLLGLEAEQVLWQRRKRIWGYISWWKQDENKNEYQDEYQDDHEDEYENALQVVGMAGLFLLLLLAGTAGAWIWSCRWQSWVFVHVTWYWYWFWCWYCLVVWLLLAGTAGAWIWSCRLVGYYWLFFSWLGDSSIVKLVGWLIGWLVSSCNCFLFSNLQISLAMRIIFQAPTRSALSRTISDKQVFVEMFISSSSS